MEGIMSNWKTTIGGVLPILYAVYKILSAIVEGTPIDLTEVIAMLGVGGGLVMAKDHNVTGGTKPQ